MQEKVIILQSSWNRYKLLKQSLPQVFEESKYLDCRFIISDDQSDDEDVLALLNEYRSKGVEVIQRAYVRAPAEPAHPLIALNNMFAFGYILEKYPECEYIIKCDNDIALIPGVFDRMMRKMKQMEDDGYDVLCFSGLATSNEPILEERDGYAVTDGACAAALIYRREDWEKYLLEAKPGNVMLEGFDCHFHRFYARKWRQGAVCGSLNPSEVFHTGFSGTHLDGQDLNVNYVGPTKDLVVR